jgi:hypothetical protein
LRTPDLNMPGAGHPFANSARKAIIAGETGVRRELKRQGSPAPGRILRSFPREAEAEIQSRYRQ